MKVMITGGNACMNLVERNVRRCLPGYAMVHTDKGLVRIKDVEIGMNALTMNGYEKIVNKFVQGKQKLVKIITRDGEFKCTSDHKMGIMSDIDRYVMRKACDIEPGDKMITTNVPIDGQENKLPELNSVFDENISWLFGIIQGYGFVQDRSVSIIIPNDNIVEDIKQQMLRFCPKVKVTISRIVDKNSVNINGYSSDFAHYIKKYIKKSKSEIRVPDFMYKTTLENKLSYISGIINTDGCTIYIYKPMIVVSTIYLEFAKDIQNILYSCGIESTLKQNIKKSFCWSDKLYYEIYLISTRSKNMFINGKSLPMGWIKQLKIDTKTNKKLEYIPVEVISIKEDEEEETYDIEVENRHEFFCNGYLSSNSAEIALGSVSDEDFINLKNFEINPERSDIAWMSNNSIVLDSNGDFSDFKYIPEMAKRICDNGEPGMINLHNIQKYGRLGKESNDKATLVNPCVTEETWILTSLGSNQVKDLINKSFVSIVNGEEYLCKSGFFHTGVQDVYEIITDEGFRIKATGEHKFMNVDNNWIQVKDLVKDDLLKINNHRKYSIDIDKTSVDFKRGFVVGYACLKSKFYLDSDYEKIIISLYLRSTKLCTFLQENIISLTNDSKYVPGYDTFDTPEIKSLNIYEIVIKYMSLQKVLYDSVENESFNFQAGFLSSIFNQSDVEQDGIHIILNNLESLLRFQRMLLRFGIYSKIMEVKRDPDRKSYSLSIQNYNIKLYADKIGFIDEKYMSILKMVMSLYIEPNNVTYIAKVNNILKLGQENVYDATIDTIHAFDGNGFYAHNCGEIPLENMETCNLAEVFPPRCNDPDIFYNALEYATFYASTVSLLPTHRPETNAVIARNRRIGVSISGIAQWANGALTGNWGQMNYTQLGYYLRNAYKVVKNKNIELANLAGIPASIRVSTVKPSGSISLLAGTTPGVHYPVSRYAIRRVRIGETSPLVDILINAGVPHEKDKYSAGTLVFEFVIDHGDVAPCEEVSPWQQFSLVQMLQKHYADNCVSSTIYFDKVKDGPDVEKMLAMFIPTLKSVSMLPHSGHNYEQAPYEPITKEQYEERLKGFNYPDYKAVKGNVPSGSKYCTGDRCEL